MEEEDISPCALIYTSRVFAASGGGDVRFPGDNWNINIRGTKFLRDDAREKKGRKGEESSPRVYQPGHYTSYVMSGSDSHIIPLYTWIDRFMSRVTERTRAFSSGARKRARARARRETGQKSTSELPLSHLALYIFVLPEPYTKSKSVWRRNNDG